MVLVVLRSYLPIGYKNSKGHIFSVRKGVSCVLKNTGKSVLGKLHERHVFFVGHADAAQYGGVNASIPPSIPRRSCARIDMDPCSCILLQKRPPQGMQRTHAGTGVSGMLRTREALPRPELLHSISTCDVLIGCRKREGAAAQSAPRQGLSGRHGDRAGDGVLAVPRAAQLLS